VEVHDLMHLSLREEPIGDAALIEDLDGPRVQTACARAGEVLAGAPFDNGNVDACQGQLPCQHQAGRACAHDQDIGTRHGLTAPSFAMASLAARVLTEETSTRMFLKSHKLRANRSCAILELVYFGPISKVVVRTSIQHPRLLALDDAATSGAWSALLLG
jgi:hypothetical protein